MCNQLSPMVFGSALSRCLLACIVFAVVHQVLQHIQFFGSAAVSSGHPQLRVDGAVANFTEWLGAHGVAHAALRIARTAAGASVAAAQLVRPSEELLTVPRSLWLSRESALRSAELRDVLEDVFEQRANVSMDEFDVVVLHLMAERLKGPASEFAPYLQLLPLQPASLLHWSRDDLDALCDEHLRTFVDTKRATFAADYRALVAALQDRYGRFGGYTRELYEWARLVVETRAFNVPGIRPPPDAAPGSIEDGSPQYVLLPLADLLNHAPDCDSLAEPSDAGGEQAGEAIDAPHVRYDTRRDSIVMTASRRFNAGEPLTFCYFAHSNRELLETYGFVLDNNPHDWALAGEARVPAAVPERERLRRALVAEIGGCAVAAGPPRECCARAEAAVRRAAASASRCSWRPAGRVATTYREARAQTLRHFLSEIQTGEPCAAAFAPTKV